LKEHREEIERLLRRESERAAEVNPLGRVIRWKRDKSDKLTVTTTTEHLAQRLGHALQKAFDGKVKYDFSHENKLARVSWRRD
jgi:YD repeat-containing protein